MAGFDTSFSDITGGLGDLFGTESTEKASGTTLSSSTKKQTEKLNIDEAALQKIISDVLGGADGLASIFGGEQTAGIFDSSVAAQAAGNLTSKLVGEIAKLTAERETVQEGTQEATTQTTAKKESGGLIKKVLGFF